MAIKYLTPLALVALTGCAHLGPPEDWTARDTALEVSWQVVNAYDLHTTQRFEDSVTHGESNVAARAAFGANPHPRDVLVVGAMAAFSHYIISKLLPPRIRPYWQGVTLALSGDAVDDNCEAGFCD